MIATLKMDSPVIAIFGFSFKKNTSDTRDSRAAYMVDFLERKGAHVRVVDPAVTEDGMVIEMDLIGLSKAEDYA